MGQRKSKDNSQLALDFTAAALPANLDSVNQLDTPKTLETEIIRLGGRPYFSEKNDSTLGILLPIAAVETLSKHRPALLDAWQKAKQDAKKLSSNSTPYEKRLTPKEALGMSSSAFAAAQHATDYPSALGFLRFTVTRIVELTASQYGRPVDSVSIALAYRETIKEIFAKYAKDTAFADALEPECIDKFRNNDTKGNELEQASISYIRQALNNTKIPIHPATRALALAVNSIKNLLNSPSENPTKTKKQNIVLINPTFTEDSYKKEFNAEYSIAKSELLKDSNGKTIDIKRIDKLPEKPTKDVSIVIIGNECPPSYLMEVQQKFPGANIIFLNKEESQPKDGQDSLFGVVKEPPRTNWHHGMDPEPRPRKRR